MNKKYFSSLLCIIVLALAPACSKKQEKPAPKEDIKKMIELDNTVFEMEEDNYSQKTVKF